MTKNTVIKKVARHLFYMESGIIDHTGDVTWDHVSTQVYMEWVTRAERLLNFIPELAVVDRKAELPGIEPFVRNELTAHNTQDECYSGGQAYMVMKFKEAGWVKEVNNV